MGKGIYTYYKERLIEIGGNNKCLYLKSIVRKSAYDIGRILEGRDAKVSEFTSFLHSNKKYPFTVMNSGEKKEILQNLDIQLKTQLSDSAQAQLGEDAEKIAKKLEKENKLLQNRANYEPLKVRALKPLQALHVPLL